MKNFSNRVAVITGAASGFGREFANVGAKLGMKLVLADVQQEMLDRTVAEFKAEGVEVTGMRCDVSKAQQVDALAKHATDTFGGVNLVFNNAGVAQGGLVWENTVKDWEWVLGVNLWGVIYGVRAFTPLMIEQSRRETDYEGHIVNTASAAGLINPPLVGAYNVSKHGVVALTETLYHDLRAVKAKIGCSVLCPAFVPTGITQSHLTRPPELKNDSGPTESMRMAQAMTEKAVGAGKIGAAEVANMTFDAVRNEQFYIITHAKIMATVNLRLEDIRNGHNPRDPFSLKEGISPTLDV